MDLLFWSYIVSFDHWTLIHFETMIVQYFPVQCRHCKFDLASFEKNKTKQKQNKKKKKNGTCSPWDPDAIYLSSASKFPWFWRWFLPDMDMAAIFLFEPWPFVQIFNPPLTESSTCCLKKTGPRVSGKRSFKGVNGRRTDGRIDNGRGVITIAHHKPLAQMS